jgi:hypothetical protein
MAAQATAFQLVLERFKLQLSDKEKRQFAATTIDDLNVAIETIQRKQLSEKKLRAMSKLERFLEGMQEYDKVVSVFLNTSAILAFVWVRAAQQPCVTCADCTWAGSHEIPSPGTECFFLSLIPCSIMFTCYCNVL